ncbi:MAG: hypothetical protein R6W82_01355 [bacterium]
METRSMTVGERLQAHHPWYGRLSEPLASVRDSVAEQEALLVETEGLPPWFIPPAVYPRPVYHHDGSSAGTLAERDRPRYLLRLRLEEGVVVWSLEQGEKR